MRKTFSSRIDTMSFLYLSVNHRSLFMNLLSRVSGKEAKRNYSHEETEIMQKTSFLGASVGTAVASRNTGKNDDLFPTRQR